MGTERIRRIDDREKKKSKDGHEDRWRRKKMI